MHPTNIKVGCVPIVHAPLDRHLLVRSSTERTLHENLFYSPNHIIDTGLYNRVRRMVEMERRRLNAD